MVEKYKPYEIITLDLGVARTDEEIEIAGNYINVLGSEGTLQIKLNNPTHDAISLPDVREIKAEFNKIYITNTAQAGKTATLLVGKDFEIGSETKLQAWDGSNWQYLEVESSTYKNLKASIYYQNREAVVGAPDSDGKIATAAALHVQSRLYGFNGSTWDRLRVQNSTYPNLRVGIYEDDRFAAVNKLDVDGASTTPNALFTRAYLYGFNGTSWDRLRVQNASYPNLRTIIFYGSNAAYVSTSRIDGRTNATGALMVESCNLGFNGESWDRVRVGATVKILNNTAITAGTPVAVWTPASGKKFRVLKLQVYNLGSTTDVIFLDGGSEFIRVPVPADSQVQTIEFGNGYLSSAADNVLSVDVAANTTLTIVAYGTEE